MKPYPAILLLATLLLTGCSLFSSARPTATNNPNSTPATPTIQNPSSAAYYTPLRAACDEESASVCCFTTLEVMEKNAYELAQDDTCPAGYKVNTLPECQDGYKWCEPE